MNRPRKGSELNAWQGQEEVLDEMATVGGGESVEDADVIVLAQGRKRPPSKGGIHRSGVVVDAGHSGLRESYQWP